MKWGIDRLKPKHVRIKVLSDAPVSDIDTYVSKLCKILVMFNRRSHVTADTALPLVDTDLTIILSKF